MSLRLVLRRYLLPILLPVSLTSLVYLYLYPIFHGSACAFPLPSSSSSSSTSSRGDATTSSAFLHTLLDHLTTTSNDDSNNGTRKAPFRLLILADPQLEGDTSLPDPSDSLPRKLLNYYTDIIHTGPSSSSSSSSSKFTSLGILEPTYTSLLKNTLLTLLREDIPTALKAVRKRLDLYGNDYYLGHVYRTLRWWARPSHVVVLGDLVGSQWVGGEEFERRGGRYWGRVFAGGERVGEDVTGGVTEGMEGEGVDAATWGREEVLGEDKRWERRVINVAGNHDVGYAGDISRRRMERFERVFGRANWDVRFRYPVVEVEGEVEEESSTSISTSTVPTLHMVVLNSMILDTPALDQSIQDETFRFLNNVIQHRAAPVSSGNDTTSSSKSFTLLLTHVPLHKREGICTDAPYFGYFDDDDEDYNEEEDGGPRFHAGGLREQNHLSDHISQKGILEGLFGMSGEEGAVAGGKGRNGLILTGHDHTGCDVVHYVDRREAEEEGEGEDDHNESEPESSSSPSWTWDATPYHLQSPEGSTTSPSTPSIRELTLRSMMGEYGGNAGFLSVWFDPSTQEWEYEVSTCMFGVQHVWWGVHVGAVVTGVVGLVWVVLEGWEMVRRRRRREGKERLGEKKRQ